MKSVFAHRNEAFEGGVITGLTGSWKDLPLISNMQDQKAFLPFAQVTPNSGNFSFSYQNDESSPTDFDVDVIGLIGHSLPQGAVITAKDAADSTIGSVTVESEDESNYIVIDGENPITTDEVKIEVSNSGSDDVRIACFWVGSSFREYFDAGWSSDSVDNTEIINAGTVKWFDEVESIEVVSGSMSAIHENNAIGLNGSENLKSIFKKIGIKKTVVFIPRADTVEGIRKTAIYGTLVNPGSLQREKGPYWTASFKIEEMR